MRNAIFGALFIMFAVHTTPASAENLYEYQLEKIGQRTDRAACEAALESIAAKFTEQSGIVPFSKGCKENNIDRGDLDGVISYFAEERISNISSRDRRIIVDSQGAFRSMEACQSGLTGRVGQFQAIFGTEPMAAWCFREYSSTSTYAARIEAIGSSVIKSVIVGFDFYGRPTAEPQSILTGLKAAAELKFPGHVVDSSMESRLAYTRTTLRYYSPVRYFLDNMVEMKFKSPEVCEDVLGEVAGMFDTLAEKPAALFCSVDGLAGIRVNLVTFTKDISAPELYQHYQAPQAFADRAACQAHAATVAGDNAAILGTVCTDMTPSVLHLLLSKAPTN